MIFNDPFMHSIAYIIIIWIIYHLPLKTSHWNECCCKRRGELAVRKLSSQKRESSCVLPVNGKTKQLHIPIRMNPKHIWSMVHAIKKKFSPTEPISEVNLPGPARPNYNALWPLISRAIKELRIKKLRQC